jgi:DNA-binding response OmpR family regulator
MAKIIIVEDDLNLANVYRQKLEEGGHSVSIIADAEAVNKIREQKPNLVLLDILMPNVSGLDILREIKADSVICLTPVLLLTNVAEDASIAKGLELGAYGYLLKAETTPNQILARVNMTLEETSPPVP